MCDTLVYGVLATIHTFYGAERENTTTCVFCNYLRIHR